MREIPNLHDAEFYGLRHDLNVGTMQCMFRTSDDREALLLLSGVRKFRCVDFGLQNIVLDLVSNAWQDVTAEDLRSYLIWLYKTNDGENLRSPEGIEQEISDVLEKRLHFVFLIPSWGSQFGATASKIEWRWDKA